MRKGLIALLIAAFFGTGCGAPSAPLPPSLRLPAPVQDLAAERRGDRVTLRWTPPRQTSDGVTLKSHWRGPTRICRVVRQEMSGCLSVVATLSPEESTLPAGHNPQQVTFTDTIPAAFSNQYPEDHALYAVEVVNNLGRSAGLSNRIPVPLAPTLVPPADLRAEVTPRAVLIRFTGTQPPKNPQLQFSYRLIRHDPAAKKNGETSVAEVPAAGGQLAFEDGNFSWQQSYEYRVVPVTRVVRMGNQVAEALGADSERLTVTARDEFPPAVPQGLQAIASASDAEPFVDLTWAPNGENDLAGYNIYREEDGKRFKLNAETVPVPSFRDSRHSTGSYVVTAVDLRGNESAASQSASDQ